MSRHIKTRTMHPPPFVVRVSRPIHMPIHHRGVRKLECAQPPHASPVKPNTKGACALAGTRGLSDRLACPGQDEIPPAAALPAAVAAGAKAALTAPRAVTDELSTDELSTVTCCSCLHARTQQTPAPTLTRTSRLTGGVDAPPPCRSCVRRANQPLQSQRGAKQSRVGRGGAEKPARTGDGLRRSECWRPPCASVRRHPSPRSGLHGAASLRV
jgi:hypothetical protein